MSTKFASICNQPISPSAPTSGLQWTAEITAEKIHYDYLIGDLEEVHGVLKDFIRRTTNNWDDKSRRSDIVTIKTEAYPRYAQRVKKVVASCREFYPEHDEEKPDKMTTLINSLNAGQTLEAETEAYGSSYEM
ncbi:hypothetical protein H2201_003821 [Coniosporium apollinis]|uniref:Uncharacterized protein n=2 Tax=Coniosporium TaxID=2810619 RepID=A0ABQ9NZU8_9PEZI|nr:hypothetical protein H2199_005001 [Cladosporium sp. JES 115]KAJ9666143.1 hypothetical protein H2201_003821 [Coniosporium apollinis]